MQQLGDFLADLARGRIESTGQFTLNLSKARAKLREYRLAEPGLYLLKLIQGAVAAGCRQFHCHIEAGEVVVEFQARARDLPLSRLLAALENPQELQDGPLRHLAIGLTAALVYRSAEVCLEAFTERSSLALRLTEETLEPLAVAASPQVSPQEVAFKLTLRRAAALMTELRLQLGERAAEHHLVYSRCRFARTEIVVDGKPIPRGWAAPTGKSWHHQFAEPFWLAQRIHRGRSRKGSLWFPPFGPSKLERSADAFLLEYDAYEHGYIFLHQFLNARGAEMAPEREQDYPVSMALLVPSALTGPTRVVAVKHGVTLEAVELESLDCPGTLCLLLGDEVETDLSEFQVRQTTAWSRRVEDLEVELRILARQLRRNLDRLDIPASKSGRMAVGQVVSLAATGLFFWKLVPVCCGVLALMSHLREGNRAEGLREGLNERLGG